MARISGWHPSSCAPTRLIRASSQARAKFLPDESHFGKFGKLVTLMGGDGEACARGLRDEQGPAYESALRSRQEGCILGGESGGELPDDH